MVMLYTKTTFRLALRPELLVLAKINFKMVHFTIISTNLAYKMRLFQSFDLCMQTLCQNIYLFLENSN